MFSRIHSLKFQNKLAKDTMKNSLKSIIDTFFSDKKILLIGDSYAQDFSNILSRVSDFSSLL